MCSTLQYKCLAKGTMAFTCKLIETARGVTTVKRGMGAENAILTNLNVVDCCQTITNDKWIYVTINSCKLQKTSGQFEISVFEIHAVRENTRLIARCPLVL